MTTSHASKHQNDHVLTDWQTGIEISNWIVASFLFRLHDVTVSNEWKQGISKHFQYQILLLYKLIEWRRSEIILYKSPMTGREQRLFPWDKSYLRGNTSPVWVEHQYIHRTRSKISHLLLCLYIFLLYKTKPLLTGGRHPSRYYFT